MSETAVDPVESPARRPDPASRVVLAAFLICAAFYALYSVVRFQRMESTVFDLGIFDQGLWLLSQFETPAVTTRLTPSIFGDHVHFAILLFVPLFWIGANTYGLLVAQSLLVCAAVFPIVRFARRRLPANWAATIGVLYLINWGVIRGLEFDFHEYALTTLVLAWTLDAFDRRAWRRFALLAIFLVATKEDQSFTLAMFGLIAMGLTSQGAKRFLIGGISIVGGVSWYLLSTRVIAPYFAQAPYQHWVYSHIAPDAPGLVKRMLREPWVGVRLLFFPTAKLNLIVKTFLPWAGLSLFSPYVLLMMPSLVSRLWSNAPNHYAASYHYSMPIAVTLACAAADTLGRLFKRAEGSEKRRPSPNALRLAQGALAVSVVASVILIKSTRLWTGFLPGYYRMPEMVVTGRRLLAQIPADASVTTDNSIGAQLSHRKYLYLGHDDLPRYVTDYVIFCPKLPTVNPKFSVKTHAAYRADPRFELIEEGGGWLFMRRRPEVPTDFPKTAAPGVPKR